MTGAVPSSGQFSVQLPAAGFGKNATVSYLSCSGSTPKVLKAMATCAIAADREDEVHALPLVEVLAERRPRRVRDVRLVVEFVDGAQHRAVELIGRLAALDAGDVVVGQPGLAGPCRRGGAHSYSQSRAVRDPQDRRARAAAAAASSENSRWTLKRRNASREVGMT